jgi:hypothetical protein
VLAVPISLERGNSNAPEQTLDLPVIVACEPWR